MVKLRWKPGFESMMHGADVDKCTSEILSIGESATAEQILNKARDENCELHKCFEWDDSIAAEKWRLKQARDVVSFIFFETVKEDNPHAAKEPIRFFAKPTYCSQNSGYKQVFHLNEDEYQKTLANAKRELEAFDRKYHTIAELQDVIEAIEAVI